jgi:hypothetical protein
MSVADYLDEHADLITTAFIRELIEHSIRSEYGVEPEESSALQLIFNLPTVDGERVEVLGGSDEAFEVEGGSGRIIDGLVDALFGRIRTDMRLRRIVVRSKWTEPLSLENHYGQTHSHYEQGSSTRQRSCHCRCHCQQPWRLARSLHDVSACA